MIENKIEIAIRDELVDWKRTQGNFLEEIEMFYDWSIGYMGEHTSQNSSDCILNMHIFFYMYILPRKEECTMK